MWTGPCTDSMHGDVIFWKAQEMTWDPASPLHRRMETWLLYWMWAALRLAAVVWRAGVTLMKTGVNRLQEDFPSSEEVKSSQNYTVELGQERKCKQWSVFVCFSTCTTKIPVLFVVRYYFHTAKASQNTAYFTQDLTLKQGQGHQAGNESVDPKQS